MSATSKYAATLHLEPPVHEWLTSHGKEKASVILAMLAKWGYALANDPVFKCLSGDGSGDKGESALSECIQFIKQSMANEWQNALQSLDHQRHLELQNAVIAERNRAEDASRTARIALVQSDERSKELESARNALSLMQRQSNARGVLGETLLEQIIAGRYTSAEITNVGLNGKSEGDLHVRIDGDGHFISVESKCSKRVDSSHVTKTMGHARGLRRKHGDKYIGHLFVSMEFQNIPDKGSMHVEYDAIEGATVAWVGLPQLQGNEEVVSFAFDVIVKSQAVHKQLKAQKEALGSSNAYEELFKYVKDMTQRMCFEMEAYVNVVRDYEDQRRLNERLSDNVKSLLKNRMKEYEALCQKVGMDARILVAGKKEENILQSVLGTSAPLCSYGDKADGSTEDSDDFSLGLPKGPPSRPAEVKVQRRGQGRRRDVSTLLGIGGVQHE